MARSIVWHRLGILLFGRGPGAARPADVARSVQALYKHGVAARSVWIRSGHLASHRGEDIVVNHSAMALLEEGNRLQRNGELAEAAERYRELLRAEPRSVAALFHLARIACQQERIVEGIDLLHQALLVDPKFAAAHSLLGMALARLDRPAEALASLDAAVECDPKSADAHGNRGDVLVALGRPADAIASYDRALALKPDSVVNWCNRGGALHDLRRYREAIASFDRVLALRPDFTEVHLNRAGALARADCFDEAIEAYDNALATDPDNVEALGNRAAVLAKLKRYEEAIASAERVLAIVPDHPRVLGELAGAAVAICDWRRAAGLRNELVARLAKGRLVVSPFVMLGILEDPKLLSECARLWVEQDIPKCEVLPRRQARRQDGRIRLAYLSADFRRHATAYLMAGLFERHDRNRFEVVGVAFGGDDRSEMRSRLERAFDRFVDVSGQSDREVAGLLHGLEIDIAVDLKGHTDGARLGILAHRPAPVQVGYLGYPGTTAVDFLDYVIADEIVLPSAQQPYFTERIVHLPDCYQVNDSKREIAPYMPARAALGLPERAFVFCCFNQAWKITEPVFDRWMHLLQKVAGSVLWLFRANETAMSNLRRAAQERGVAPDRLIFAPFSELPEHLARLKQADLFLDTLPYNAHTTASDALWAGLPVLTCTGSTFAGRVAASLLHAAGLPELVTASLCDYETRALELATDPAQLQMVRRKLADNRQICPLFDTDRFRRHIEAAYLTMWEIDRRGESPRGFRVEPIDR